MMQHIFHSFIRNFLFLFLATLCTQLAFAGYKPVDVSDITGEQRKVLMDAKKGIARMPAMARDCFFCEQLGLCFKKDGSQAMVDYKGYPGTKDGNISCFVGSSGRPEIWGKACRAGSPQWHQSYEEVKKFKRDAVIGLFKKEVERCILNTAKYLLKELPDERRWTLLASMGGMLSPGNDSIRTSWKMDCGFYVPHIFCEGRGRTFLSPEGKELDVRKVLANQNERYWRWHQLVWRCRDLVGAKDILALFPDEVKAMRKAYKQRLAGIAKKAEEAKAEQEARNEALVNAADEALKELDPEQRRAWLAEHFGFCYTSDGRPAYQSARTANNDALFVDADGKERKLSEVANKSDEKWIAATNAAMIVKYNEQFMARRKDELEDLACRTAYTVLASMPVDLRQSWLAERNHFFFLPDMKNPYGGTENRTLESGVKITPMGTGWNYGKCLYYDPSGKMVRPVVLPSEWDKRWRLLYLCESLSGIEAINSFFPDEVNAMREYFEESPFLKAYKKSLAEITKKAEKAKTEQEARNEALVNAADAMLEELSPEQRRAWLAEHLGFCYTSDGRPAYQSERTANDDALFVDADGNERKLSEVANKSDEKWVAATKAAIIVNYNEQFIAHRKDELKDLAEKTAHVILASMPAAYRQQFFAENNRLFFLPDGREVFRDVERRAFKLESGVTMYYLQAYEAPLFYNVDGKMTQCFSRVTQEWRRWNNRWHLLFLCENIIGIEPINAGFGDEVNAMREHYEKSPFCKK